METLLHRAQFCVVGGGLAGVCAAIAAARHGVETVLMQERPVFGGNSSSEIRMFVCGTPGFLETGLIEEFRLENLYRNNTPNYSVWDSVLFEKVRFQKHLTSLLNCSCLDAQVENGKLLSVTGWQLTTQTFHKVEAEYFADCSGDSILAPLSGAEFRIGREARMEFGESLAPDAADSHTMGLTCVMQARQTSSPKKFIPPLWAYRYPDENSFPQRDHNLSEEQNFWYLELGGDQDSIRDTESIRDELLKTAFGFWDHVKNHGDHGAENWALDWVGFLPGKRESRRYVGDYVMTQRDVLEAKPFPDGVAFGGWPVDDHHPDGFRHFGAPNTNVVPKQPYEIPLRSLYSRNVKNLWFAGRNVSVSHVALSSCRVMATCATLGQAVGTAVAAAIAHGNLSPREVCAQHIREIQLMLMEDDCTLLHRKREVSPLCRNAALTADTGDAEALRSGVERDLPGEKAGWSCQNGSFVEYRFAKPEKIHSVRIIFDSNLARPHLNMVGQYLLPEKEFGAPPTLVKAFHVDIDEKEAYRCEENHQRFVRIEVPETTAWCVRLVIDEVRQTPSRLFAFDVK